MSPKEYQRWQRTRERGFAAYVLLMTAMLGAVRTGLHVLIDYLQGESDWYVVTTTDVLESAIFGASWGVLDWIVMERRFRRSDHGDPPPDVFD